MKHNSLLWSGAGLMACIVVAISLFVAPGLKTPVKAAPAVICSQSVAAVAATHGIPLLNPDGAGIVVPQSETRIVATVNGYTITAARLEMMVQNTVYNNHAIVTRLGPEVPLALQEQLTRSPATLRQLFLTKLIDDELWVLQGQHDGGYAPVADAHKLLALSLATFHSTPTTDPARVQFVAFLCTNHLTETSYLTNAQVVQNVQNALTIAAAKARVHATLAPTQRQNSAAIRAVDNTYVQSLWTRNTVNIFLTGFVPLRK